MTKRSNLTALYLAVEVSIGVLSGTDTWQGHEPNTYSDTGGQIEVMQRQPIDPGRQNKKGTTVDLDATLGFNTDHTKSNLLVLLMGFLYADAREQPATQPLVGTAVPITSVTAGTYVAASGLLPFNIPNLLVWAEGFGTSNDGLKLVASAIATAVTASGTSVQAGPPAAAKLTGVGKQFASGDLSVTYSGGLMSLVSAASAMPTNLLPGSWVYIGGDTAPMQFATCPKGMVRVRSVTASTLVVDLACLLGDAAPAVDAGAGKTIQLFFGTVIRNEPTSALIKRRTFQAERQLGLSGTGINGMEAEYILGCVPNEMTINIPGQDKINVDMSFVGTDVAYASGEVGDTTKPGTRVAALAEDAFNTSTDVKFAKLAIIPTTGSTAGPLFAYATEMSIGVNNNNNPSKAVGKLGAIDVHEGNIDVTGSFQAYFATTPAIKAVRQNADVGFVMFAGLTGKNAGFIYDIPLLQVGDGQLNIEKDEDTMVPLDIMGCQSKFGHTILHNYFPYLPSVATA